MIDILFIIHFLYGYLIISFLFFYILFIYKRTSSERDSDHSTVGTPDDAAARWECSEQHGIVCSTSNRPKPRYGMKSGEKMGSIWIC
jgi:hypothetical protein